MQINNERHPADEPKISANGPLNGGITVSGAKNTALPLICTGLLTFGTLRLKNVPMLADVRTTQKLLQGMGVRALTDNISKFEINGGIANNTCTSYELVRTMRASILVLGPTLARFGEAQASLPGDYAIGPCSVDQHLKGLEIMGAEITIEHGYVKAKGRLKDTRVTMDVATVGGIENLLMAAVLAEGTTILENYVIEPEVIDLAECLVKMGTKISGIGTATMAIEGVKELHSREHNVVPGYTEASTFLCAVATTGGEVVLHNAASETMEVVLSKLTEAGAIIEVGDNWISIDIQQHPKAVDIRAVVHPGFPTDMQTQSTAMNAIVEGSSRVVETIFENRLVHAPELNRMGADITTEGNTVYIKGVEKLSGTVVMATDLHASVSLVMAGLVAGGETTVERIYHLDRGYEYIEKKLGSVGAKIERVCG